MLSKEIQQKIIQFYSDGSKHSNYQNYPDFVAKAIGKTADINEDWRGDSARFSYLSTHLNFQKDCLVGDIGANTGKFCLDFAYQYPDTNFAAVEINQHSCEFIEMIIDAFALKNIKIYNQSAELNYLSTLPYFDIAFHMNVLHHSGVDFEQEKIKDTIQLQQYIVSYLSKFSEKCTILVFQLGYNWGGNKAHPIVSPDAPLEMIAYQKQLFLESNWEIEKMALFHYQTKQYHTINSNCSIEELKTILTEFSFEKNSEFYKRPLFLLKSKLAGGKNGK